MRRKVDLLKDKRLPLSAVAFFYARGVAVMAATIESARNFWVLANNYMDDLAFNIRIYIFLYGSLLSRAAKIVLLGGRAYGYVPVAPRGFSGGGFFHYDHFLARTIFNSRPHARMTHLRDIAGEGLRIKLNG